MGSGVEVSVLTLHASTDVLVPFESSNSLAGVTEVEWAGCWAPFWWAGSAGFEGVFRDAAVLRRVFQAFEKYCKVENGYVGTPDVTRVPPVHDETMQSFFLAVRTLSS